MMARVDAACLGDAARTVDAELDRLTRRVYAEYVEMPGMALTLGQARRLWQLDASTCTRLLDSLVSSGFLTKTPTGAYVRLTGT